MSRFIGAWFKKLPLIALLAVVFCLGRADTPRVSAQNPNAAASLMQRVAELERLLEHVHRVDGELEGLSGPHLIFEGCNVHVRNATGETFETDGTGNLIVGYNESPVGSRSGSHNLVIGPAHTYSAHSGLVAGSSNAITANYATVSGGYGNTASAGFASVSGGALNTASGLYSSVTGGQSNTASGQEASVSAGFSNEASGNVASVTGGIGNVASASSTAVSGGLLNTASENYAVVSGGRENIASGNAAIVIGGLENTASADYSIAP